jgi:predicted nucleic acid-binding protein
MLLLDAGVWIDAAAPANRWHQPAQALIRKPPEPLGAIDLTLYEVANVIGAREGRPEVARTVGEVLRRRCGERILALDPELLEATLQAVAAHRLTAYDAAYVAAAGRYGWQLVSTDIRDLVSKGLAVTPDAAVYP